MHHINGTLVASVLMNGYVEVRCKRGKIAGLYNLDGTCRGGFSHPTFKQMALALVKKYSLH